MQNEVTITQFIEDMLTEFHKVFSLEVICKLIVVYACVSKEKYKDIVTFLKNELQEDWIINIHELTDIEEILNFYLAPDHNKVTRLKIDSYTIPSLLSCIGYKNFIDAVLKKYPYPVMIGFPFNKWTPNRMRKFIQLYFHISDNELENSLPALKTIQDKIYLFNKEYPLLKSHALRDIVNYYKNIESYNHLLFLYTKKETYAVSNNDKAAEKIAERYNETCFCTLLDLTNNHADLERIYSSSYNNDKCINNLTNVFNHCIEQLNFNSAILIINQQENKYELYSYYKDLDYIPYIPLLLFKTPNILQTVLNNVGFEKESVNLKLLQESLSSLGELGSRSNKDNYLHRLHSALKIWSERKQSQKP